MQCEKIALRRILRRAFLLVSDVNINDFLGKSTGAGAPCGIDIEADRTVSARIREKFLNNAPESEAIARWTERESRGKLLGGGFFDTESDAPVSYKQYFYNGVTVTVCTYEGAEISDGIETV